MHDVKKTRFLIFFLLSLFLLSPFFYLFSPPRLRDYVYRELCYHTIINRIDAKSSDVNDFLKKTVNYVYTNIDSHNSPPIIDDTSWDCFLRGFGYCDQQVWALSTLLAKKNIPARLVMLKGKHPTSGHSVAEVYINGLWRIVDPHVNAIYYRKNGDFATFSDIQKNLVKLDAVVKENMAIALYTSYFAKDYPPERWAPLTKKQGVFRKIVFSPVYTYFKVFGVKFSHLYQDLYLIGKDKKAADRHRHLTRLGF